MHIPDGILPPPVWVGGYCITLATATLTIRRIQRHSDPTAHIPKASLLTAAFFVGSSIYVPFGPTSIHLLLNGLMGILLGLYSFPGIVVGLLFQALMIGHGGITTLGVNALILGIPALLARPVFGLYRWLPQGWGMGLMAFVASALSTALTVFIFFVLLISSLDPSLDAAQERQAIVVLALAHMPLLVLEGGFAVALVLFLRRVRPELLGAPV